MSISEDAVMLAFLLVGNDAATLKGIMKHLEWDWEEADLTMRAMNKFFDGIWDFKNQLGFLMHHGFPGDAPQNVKDDLVMVFRKHVPIMAGLSLHWSDTFLNTIVDKILKPITWSILSTIVLAALDDFRETIRGMGVLQTITNQWRLYYYRRFLEARRQIPRLMCTCKAFRAYLLAADVEGLV